MCLCIRRSANIACTILCKFIRALFVCLLVFLLLLRRHFRRYPSQILPPEIHTKVWLSHRSECSRPSIYSHKHYFDTFTCTNTKRIAATGSQILSANAKKIVLRSALGAHKKPAAKISTKIIIKSVRVRIPFAFANSLYSAVISTVSTPCCQN